MYTRTTAMTKVKCGMMDVITNVPVKILPPINTDVMTGGTSSVLSFMIILSTRWLK